MNNEIPQNPVDAEDLALNHIVDDSEERAECSEWIYREFVAGREADEMLCDLTENGWPLEDAEAMVEAQRRATRHLRGVVTREEVARVSEARYRQSFTIAQKMAVGGILWVGIHFLMTLTSAFRIPWPTHKRAKREEA